MLLSIGCFLFNCKNIRLAGIPMISLTIILTGQLFAYTLTPDNRKYYNIVKFICLYSFFIGSFAHINPKISFPERMMKAFVYIALISGIYATLFQLGSNIFSFRTNGLNIENVYISFWGHRNTFAGILLSGIIALLYFMKVKMQNNRTMKIFLLFLLANLIITLSRTAYVAIAAFYLMFYLLRFKHHKKQTILICFIPFLLFFLYNYNASIAHFVDTYMIREEAGLTGRDLVWAEGLSLLDGSHLWLGYGMGYNSIFLKDSEIVGNAGFHNMYLTYLVDGGIILLVSYIFCIIFVIHNLMKKVYPINENICFYWLSAIFACHVYVFFEAATMFNMTYICLFLTLFSIYLPLLYTKVNLTKI